MGIDLSRLQQRYYHPSGEARYRPPRRFRESEATMATWRALAGARHISHYCDHAHTTRHRLDWAHGFQGQWDVCYSTIMARRTHCVELATEMETAPGPFYRRLEVTYDGPPRPAPPVQSIERCHSSHAPPVPSARISQGQFRATTLQIASGSYAMLTTPSTV